MVKFIIEGKVCTTTKHILMKIPESSLSVVFSGIHQHNNKKIEIPRSLAGFDELVKHLRDDFRFPDDPQRLDLLTKELKHWGIDHY